MTEKKSEKKDERDEMFSEKKESKEVAKKESTEVADPMQRAIGTEGVHSEDVTLPRLRLIQSTSKEAEEGNTKPGMIKHSITEEEYEKLEVILVTISKNRVMFDPENRRGGPVCRSFDMLHGSGCECGCEDNCKTCAYSKGFPSQCNIIYNYPCALVDTVGKEMLPTLLSFMKSSVPVAQKINASVIGKVPAQPFWNYVWEIGSIKKDYKKGRSAFVYTAKVSRETTAEEKKWAEMMYTTFFKDVELAQQRMAPELGEEEV